MLASLSITLLSGSLCYLSLAASGTPSIKPPDPFTTIVLSGFLCYLSLVHFLRFRRLEKLISSLGFKGLTREELYKKMSLADAQLIQRTIGELEFPRLYEASLQFALFRTYAIPSISAILKNTKQFATSETAPKRYTDTEVLIAEFVTFPLNSERGSTAVARMNYLHSLYPTILPRDTLYTLLLFATQPIIFIRRYEWRQPHPIETVAMWRYWTELGIRMGIPVESIPGTFEDMMTWVEDFEKKYMVPNETNKLVGRHTLDILVYYIPRGWLREWGEKVVACLMDPVQRSAMMIPNPPPLLSRAVHTLISLRSFLIYHTHLPRTTSATKYNDHPNAHGRYNWKGFTAEPWYYAPTFAARYGPWSWIARIAGWPLVKDGDWAAEGYAIERVGPKEFEARGGERVREGARKIREMGMGGCPFG